MTLRSRVIRLAHTNPGLRPHLLPLLKTSALEGDMVYEKALHDLADLTALSENAQDILDGFNAHYASSRTAAMDPQIKSELDIYNKVKEGQELAATTVKAMESLVKMFPDESKYAKTLADASKMLEKFKKQRAATVKVIQTLSKKLAPKELTAFSKKLMKKIESMLIDTSTVRGSFDHGEDPRGNAQAAFVVTATIPHRGHGMSDYEIAQRGPGATESVSVWLRESMTGEPGVFNGLGDGTRRPYNWDKATVDGAVDLFLKATEGWKNIKGEAEGQAARKGLAEDVAYAVSRVVGERATTSPDFRKINGEYRAYSLPKEGAYDVGEYEYEQMVNKEISGFRKKLDAALSPWKDKIKNIDISDGEKSWIYVEVTIK